MEAPRDVPLRPGSRPVLFSGGRPLPASCCMLAGLAGFLVISPVMSGPWSPTPCRLVLKSFVHESRVCMTVLFQCKLWLLPALFISQSPAHHRVYRDARSRDRERGLSKLSGVDVLYMFILRDPIGSFSDWQRYARPTAERPCRIPMETGVSRKIIFRV